ncbi:MAG: hypothetical protein AAF548_12985 [Actinomycetota bacterium]
MSEVSEITVRVVRCFWRVTFVNAAGATQVIDRDTLGIGDKAEAADVIRRREGLLADWRPQVIALLAEEEAAFRAAVPSYRLDGDGGVVDVWVDDEHRGSIYGSSGDGWNAYLSFDIDLREPFEEGFYASRDEAAAAVAAGLVNGRRR